MATSNIPTDWSTLSKINSELESLISTRPAVGNTRITEKTTVESIRAFGNARPKAPKWPGVSEREIHIPARDGFENRALVFSASDEDEGTIKERGPLLVLIHGGGFCVGEAEQESFNCRTWVKERGGVALSIEHRLAPEAKFPVPVEDCIDSLKWIASNFQTLNADPTKGFILGGASSGSTCANVAAHHYRDEKIEPPLTGLYLSVTSPCMPAALPEKYASDKRLVSWEQNANAPVYNSKGKELWYKSYPAPADSPYRSPLLWPTGHAGLPPTYFQIAGLDQSRDYALLYDEILREQGVKTKLDLFPGLPHGFWGFFPDAEFTADFRAKTGRGMDWLLREGGGYDVGDAVSRR